MPARSRPQASGAAARAQSAPNKTEAERMPPVYEMARARGMQHGSRVAHLALRRWLRIMRPMIRRSIGALLPIAAIALAGCNQCDTSRRGATRAWGEVADHALTEAAFWGKSVVEELNKGRYGVPEMSAKERDRWRKAYEKAVEARGVAEGGLGWTEELKKAHDALTVLEPQKTNKDWQRKLKEAKDASYLVSTACGSKK